MRIIFCVLAVLFAGLTASAQGTSTDQWEGQEEFLPGHLTPSSLNTGHIDEIRGSCREERGQYYAAIFTSSPSFYNQDKILCLCLIRDYYDKQKYELCLHVQVTEIGTYSLDRDTLSYHMDISPKLGGLIDTLFMSAVLKARHKNFNLDVFQKITSGTVILDGTGYRFYSSGSSYSGSGYTHGPDKRTKAGRLVAIVERVIEMTRNEKEEYDEEFHAQILQLAHDFNRERVVEIDE